MIGLIWTNKINLEIQRFRKYSEFRINRCVYVIDASDLIAERTDSELAVKVLGRVTRRAFHEASSVVRRLRSTARTVEEVERFDNRVDDLYASVRGKLPMGAVRSSAYLNWKYADHPFAKTRRLVAFGPNGELVGLVVLGSKLRIP